MKPKWTLLPEDQNGDGESGEVAVLSVNTTLRDILEAIPATTTGWATIRITFQDKELFRGQRVGTP